MIKSRKCPSKSRFWLLFLSILLVPVAAQAANMSSDTPSCGVTSEAAARLFEAPGAYQPLAPEERLFQLLPEAAKGLLEVRYFVDDAPHLIETVELQAASLPRVTPWEGKARRRGETSFDPRQLLEGRRMLELLALRPDLVRQLRELDAKGRMVEVEILVQGGLVARLGFDELVRQSSELAASRAVPLVVSSRVEGPGDAGEPVREIAASTYLEDCGDCTTSTPCDTECGWDEGKGGPVTCGEYGVCEPSTCQCEYTPSYSWTGWYSYAFYPNNPSYYACYNSFFGGSRWHRLYVRVYRRDRIERKTVCPNCPSCSGCYVQETLVQYQLAYSQCWLEETASCSPGSRPCCSSLCQYGPFTPCNNC